jgi:hypothetical protein
VKPGLVEVFAYQETLLIMAVFGIAILAMIWVGFRHWLRSKERMDRLLSEQTVQFGAHMERVEARLNTIEQMVTDGGIRAAAQIEPSAGPPPDPISNSDSLRANP